MQCPLPLSVTLSSTGGSPPFSLFPLRAPEDLPASGPAADLYPEGWRHCETTNPIPGDRVSPMLGLWLGTGQGLIWKQIPRVLLAVGQSSWP